mmetsp:Transcript_15881/g.23918  ORF Transcript_15881/g.23918 Transcript_15881/m.23918 type:complete len:623 (+) Transcript_15881:114-1982(+)|eukprot:CAMPEP_0185031790 /NCGR_PEP_ID=MMETSP1103-20130426/19437_1 /TAXON_ID=36769 /ORGANISM="Paraphysomonas bandaiensis, Strain Caron Lab Isolate" /LENGTH=622 /DNA_ID=CAMNT_0027567431 /DNA_START=8 /DNA_END=1876 /DNA_ORIENTATION=-
MNPNAKPFVFSPNAASWTPPSASSVPPPPPTTEEQASIPDVSGMSIQSSDEVKNNVTEDPPVDSTDEPDDIDESDPLWIATIKITNGNKAEAMKLLEDPDALMQYPEIKRIMEGDAEGDTEVQDWEQQATPEVEASTEKTTTKEDTNVKKSPAKEAQNDDDADADADGNDDQEEVDSDPRDHMNLVFIGHVDAGKSTLSGSILYLMGKVDARTIDRFEKEAKQRNRESWFLAFIMDTSEEERAKGKTVEVGRALFETDNHRYTILDAPGHKNYVPNMISGAAQADIGVLVISARRGEFETGFEKGGQTREHALLAKTLGVRFLVVVINKMDDPTVGWAQERFEECVSKLKPFLKSCGYAIKKDVRFLPISGLTGDNILNEVSAENCPWWRECYSQGTNNTSTPTLISTLDAFNISDRDPDGKLRIPVLDRYMERGCVVMGKVESGTVRVGDEVAVLPTRKKAVVEAIYANDIKLRFARPGENVLVKFSLNIENVQKGYVLSSVGRGLGCPAVKEFVVQLALVDMVDHRPIFSTGYDCVMHIHTAEVEVTCVALLSVTDKKGQESKKRFALQGQQCVAKLSTPLTTCMELYSVMPALGRLTLRDEGKTIAIGKVIKLLRHKSA